MTIEDEERKEPPLTIGGKRYYNATQAADYLGISRSKFYKRVHNLLNPIKPPNYDRLFYTEDDLRKFKEG